MLGVTDTASFPNKTMAKTWKEKREAEIIAGARGLVSAARWLTVVSWLFYPIVFVFPMIGFTGGAATTAVQVGYTVADVVAKAVFGVLVFMIAARKSELEASPTR